MFKGPSNFLQITGNLFFENFTKMCFFCRLLIFTNKNSLLEETPNFRQQNISDNQPKNRNLWIMLFNHIIYREISMSSQNRSG